MTEGAKYFQQRYQNMLGLWPVICSTQSQNLSAPNTQPMATVWRKESDITHTLSSGRNLAMMAQSASPDLQSSDPAYPSVSRAHQDIRSGVCRSGAEGGCYFDKDVMHNVRSYEPYDTCHHMTFCYKHWFLLGRIILNFSFRSSPLHECYMALNIFTHRGKKVLFLKNIVTLTVRFHVGPARV